MAVFLQCNTSWSATSYKIERRNMKDPQILGFHHVTAIAGDAQKNYDFYTRFLGLRLVKKTVNFDDPERYHFYFGNETGEPGTIITFFPWGENVRKGLRGVHQITEVGLSVPAGSLEFWKDRADQYKLIYNNISKKFGERYLTILDPDGLKLELTESKEPDSRSPWLVEGISPDLATRGIHQVTISTLDKTATANILTEVFGYVLENTDVNRFRFRTNAVADGASVDLVETLGEQPGIVAGGSVHHVAFRVKTVEDLLYFRKKIAGLGLHITEKIDRNYFYSLYFREPGGVLFEIATDEPGFLVDENLEELGQNLQLPEQYEGYRDRLKIVLPVIN